MPGYRPERVVSGGQTGVDRAALDVALELRIPCGGWCPRGRLAEDGVIADRYPLVETPSDDPAQRTEWNVRDSDGTLVILRGLAQGGTLLTLGLTRRLGRPCRVLDLRAAPHLEPLLDALQGSGIRTLNVAGPRESECGGIGAEAAALLRRLFSGTA